MLGAGDQSQIDTTLFDTMVAARAPRVAPEADQAPLPRREIRRSRPIIPVKVRLHAEEAPRVVHVDGRPPSRGIDPRTMATSDADDGIVVPIKSARATA